MASRNYYYPVGNEHERGRPDVENTNNAPRRSRSSTIVKSIPPAFLVALFVVVLVITTILIIYAANKDNNKKPPPTPFTVGGTALFTAPNVFIDKRVLQYLDDTMTDLTASCTLSAPAVTPLLGTYAATTASWTALKDELEGVCDFYGLYSMEQRMGGALEGPLDICHAYVSVGFQIIAVYYNNTVPPNILQLLLFLYPKTYPLQMYWDRSSFSAYDVATDLQQQINAYALAVKEFQQAGGSIQAPSIQTYQTAFCNKYFGQSDLTQYNSIFQPWLAFPFQGLVQKLADTGISNSLQGLLGPIDFTPGSDIKAIYAIGSQYQNDDRIALFSKAVLGGLDIIVVTDPPNVALPAIKQSLYTDGLVLNTSMTPVFVFGTYTDNIAFYNAFEAEGDSIILALTENSNTQTQEQINVNLATAIQSALGARFMSALDFSTTHPYQITFGPAYTEEKFVADIITLLIGTQVTAQSTESSDILNTFSIKNTVVFESPGNIVDLGGRLTQEQAIIQLTSQGGGLGIQMPFFSLTLTDSTPLGGNLTAAAELLGVAPPKPPPSKFDWRQTLGKCLPAPIDQKTCENCWAIASTRSMSARECIRNNGNMAFEEFMSVYHVTTCSNLPQGKNGCNPQYPHTAFTFMTGDVHTQQCMPTVLQGKSATGCQQSCNTNAGSLADVSGIVPGSFVRLDNPTDIKISLVNDGPLPVGFSVPEDFYTFFPLNAPNPNGVYMIDPDLYTFGGHMVILVGYDDTAPVPYWIVQNSWGSIQGSGGYLKLQQDKAGLLSKSEMWIDTYAWAATPRARKSATNPSTIIFQNAAKNNPSAALVKPTVSTSQLGCPTIVANTNQSQQQATLQGCPNSAQSFVSVPEPVNTRGGNTLGAASSIQRISQEVYFVVFLLWMLILM